MRDEAQRRVLMRFFKTGPGEYGYGDEFLGIKVPQTRAVVRVVPPDYPLSEVPPLLLSPWHEVRLCGFLILVKLFESTTTRRALATPEAAQRRREVLEMYLRYARQANNWDLVDLSAPKILGAWTTLATNTPSPAHPNSSLFPLHSSLTPPSPAQPNSSLFPLHSSLTSPSSARSEAQQILDSLASSNNLWEQRISMVSTLTPTRNGDPSWCLRYAERHLSHPHDLMHKAVGWMLREMGKHTSMDLLRSFLQQHLHEMHRTTLRYAIEKMEVEERRYWMNS
ncbi:MAG: DNA alkylation repair protein [Bacteroidales bacterium]|nr:DNA alkylation repair protein [Bacteroidales bacterium]